MFFDNGLEFGNPELNVGLSQGFLTNLTVNLTTLSNPAAGTTAGANIAPFTIQSRMPVDYKSPYSQQWSLDVQRQVGNSWLFDIGYYGSNGIHLPGFEDLNQPPVASYLKLHNRNSLPRRSGLDEQCRHHCADQQHHAVESVGRRSSLCRLRSRLVLCGRVYF